MRTLRLFSTFNLHYRQDREARRGDGLVTLPVHRVLMFIDQKASANLKLTTIAMLLTLTTAACGGLPPSPSVPSSLPAPSVSPPPIPTSVVAPTPPPTGLQPTIAGVSPSVVTTAGTWGTITGSQFENGATVTISNATVFSTVRDSTTIQFSNSGAHAAGSVDITVTNPGGHAATLAGGYTFAPPDVFDANGDWIAHADGSNHYLTDMRFTIQNNALIALSCGSEVAPVTMPIPLAMQNGGFSFSGVNGLSMSGKLDSMTTSEGRVNAPGCGDGGWWADKSVRY